MTPDRPLPMLVFFCSRRSGPARRMESLLAHLARKEKDRVRIRRVDVDASPDLAERFEITVIPTLVLVDGKRALGRIGASRRTRALEAGDRGSLSPPLT